VLRVDDRFVFLAGQVGLLLVSLLEVVQIFEKKNPRGLFGLIKLRGAACLFPKNVVDILEGLFEHAHPLPARNCEAILAQAAPRGQPGC
jgi:hypothetical protein